MPTFFCAVGPVFQQTMVRGGFLKKQKASQGPLYLQTPGSCYLCHALYLPHCWEDLSERKLKGYLDSLRKSKGKARISNTKPGIHNLEISKGRASLEKMRFFLMAEQKKAYFICSHITCSLVAELIQTFLTCLNLTLTML